MGRPQNFEKGGQMTEAVIRALKIKRLLRLASQVRGTDVVPARALVLCTVPFQTTGSAGASSPTSSSLHTALWPRKDCVAAASTSRGIANASDI
ncbi:hypothetical protein BOX15_Mlig031181g3 [Macrostomum lignano]|uniref:Uncharacterized protein n=1 Tax=Macrostomum lignano TaxID=282301 RepID=A0A267DX98_9PLAT|nr:hypothetical protein BOX15_Mlig031181g3 [Macrostomum lignano]